MKYDFSTARIHCSVIGYLMSEGKGKTPRKKYQDAVDRLKEWQDRWDAMGTRLQGMANGKKIAGRIEYFKGLVAMLEPTKDQAPLSRSAKSFLKRYYARLKYGKWSASLDKGNRFTQKGKLAEKDSIALLSILDQRALKKNDTRLQSQFLTGEIDVFIGEDILEAVYIYDVKTSWDVETFFPHIGDDLYSLYWWQMQGYFSLCGATEGEVSYCLVNTPDSIIEEEKYRLFRRLNVLTEEDPIYKQAEAEMVKNMIFDDMPAHERRIKFRVKRDDEAILRIYEKVELARQFLSEFQELHEQGEFEARQPQDEEVLEETEEETSFESN